MSIKTGYDTSKSTSFQYNIFCDEDGNLIYYSYDIIYTQIGIVEIILLHTLVRHLSAHMQVKSIFLIFALS